MAGGTLNKVTLIGNLGTDPEIKHFEGGGSLARFPIATSESYTNRNGEEVNITEWHTIIARGKLVDVVEKYLKKGDKVYIEGRIRTRSWQDANKEMRYTTEVQTDTMIMLGSSRNAAAAAQNPQASDDNAAASTSGAVSEPKLSKGEGDAPDDDLPF